MAQALPNIGYLSKDYEAFRADLINLIPMLLPEWTDYSESDPGITLVELLSYGLDILSYYQDRMANEVYLPTATQKQSVIDLCALIGYRLKTAVPSQTSVYFTITPQAQDYRIPAGFQVATPSTPYTPAVVFETTQDLVIPAGYVGNEKDGSGNYLYTVPIIQGITYSNEVLGSSNNQPNQTFTLKNPGVIIDGPQGSSLHVYVNQGAGFEEWTDVTDSFNSYTSSGKQYTWTIDAQDYLTVKFGDGLSGIIPAQGINNVTTTYRVGGGADTNVGTNAISVVLTPDPNVKTVANPTSASGGDDEETIDHAKQFAPLSLRTGNRAVTAQDYITLAQSIPGVVLAQATTKSGVQNTVYVTVAPVGGGIPTSTLKTQVFNYLNDIKTITTQVVMQDPKYAKLAMTVNVTVGSSTSNAQVKTALTNALTTSMDITQRQFGLGGFISSTYKILNSIQGVEYLTVVRFTLDPRIDTVQSTGNPTWSTVTVKSGNTYAGLWKVQMTSATAFTVYYNPSGDGTTWVQDGTGTFGTQYNSVSSGTSISFTITAGTTASVSGDNWTFKTSSYLDNISIDSDEILLLDTDVVINVTGGV